MRAPRVVGHPLGSGHGRAYPGGGFRVEDPRVEREIERYRREPHLLREKADDAAVRDELAHRSCDHVEQALVVRRRFGERSQRPGQNVKAIFSAIGSGSGFGDYVDHPLSHG